MSRLTQRQYERRLMAAMAVYMVVMLGIWPMLRTAHDLPLKVLLALAPVLPMLYVMTLMARRIRDSDELEQRTHLLALGGATGAVGALSMIGGFLASAKVLPLDGTILILVFPAMMFCYGIARWGFARRYGVILTCEEQSPVPLYLRFALMALVLGGAAWVFRGSMDDSGTTLSGTAAGFGLLALGAAVARWRHRHAAVRDAS
jgi:hypothetical protein